MNIKEKTEYKTSKLIDDLIRQTPSLSTKLLIPTQKDKDGQTAMRREWEKQFISYHHSSLSLSFSLFLLFSVSLSLPPKRFAVYGIDNGTVTLLSSRREFLMWLRYSPTILLCSYYEPRTLKRNIFLPHSFPDDEVPDDVMHMREIENGFSFFGCEE